MPDYRRVSRHALAGLSLVCLAGGWTGMAQAQTVPWASQPGGSRWDLPARDFSRHNQLFGSSAISLTVNRQQIAAAPITHTDFAALPVIGDAKTATPIIAAAAKPETPAPQQPQSTPAVHYATPAFGSSLSVSGGPNVFGSVALAIPHTPLDGQWRRVGRTAGVRPAGYHQLRRTAGTTAGRAQLEAVNRWVNSRASFVNDRGDRWVSAAEFLARGAGDCEDFALAKLQLLRQLGFPQEDLYLVIVRDLVRRADHAVLVARLGDEMLMLDNNSDVIVDARRPMDYRPIFSYSSAGRWIHGYRHTPSNPVRTASLSFASAGVP